MQLPVDIPAVLKAATDLEEAAKTPLSVSVLIDDTAPGDCVGHVRAAFASTGAHTRVTIGYLDDEPVQPHGGDDFAVLVAGTAPFIGAQAARLREAGIPVMVATTLPSLVHDAAVEAGWPIPTGDICAPGDEPIGAVRRALDKVLKRGEGTEGRATAAGPDAVDPAADVAEAVQEGADELALAAEPGEPFALDEEAVGSFDVRMGEWICAAVPEKKLACALAFPFVRRPLALDAVNATSMQNGAVGLVPIIPGADMPIMTLNQMKMLLQIAAAYGQPLDANRIKELAAVLGGAFVLRNVARSAAGFVPVLGWAVRGAVGFAGTEAMGRMAIEYFEAGGDLVGVASVVQNGSGAAVDAVQKAAATPAGGKVLGAAKDAAGKAVKALRGAKKKGKR